MQISPAMFIFCFLEKVIRNAPIPAISGAKKAGWSIAKASPREFKETIQAVIVVPILAPMITPTAWVRFRIPALTNPTTMTVVAALLWRIAVISAPRSTPRGRLFVTIPKNWFILLPAVFCMPSPMMFIP